MESASVLAIKSHSPNSAWSTKLKQLEHGGVKVKFANGIKSNIFGHKTMPYCEHVVANRL